GDGLLAVLDPHRRGFEFAERAEGVQRQDHHRLAAHQRRGEGFVRQAVTEFAAMSARIPIDREKIAEFCRRWKITEFALFGSVLRDDFRPDSDVDVLVTFAPDTRYSLFDLVHMQDELKQIFGREVDLVERKAVERSENYIRRKHILSSVEPVYVA